MKTQKLPEIDLDTVPMLEEPEEDVDGLAEYTFPKFAVTYFQKSATHTHIQRPLRYPLLYHEDDTDCSVAMALWFLGAHPTPRAPSLTCGSEGMRKGPGTLWAPVLRLTFNLALCFAPPGRPGSVEHHPEVHG